MIQHILAPVDGSEHSKKALEFACNLARKFNAEISIIHVVEAAIGEQTLVLGSSHMTIPAPKEEILKTGQSMIDAATEIARKAGCVLAGTDVLSGSVANNILEYAENHTIDTIVMGSRGLGNVAGLLLGSISHKVSHLAKCTCITVR